MKPNSSHRNRSFRSGFTLVELLVVIAILGILAVISLTSFQTSQMKARDARRKSDLSQIAKAMELFYNDNERYPGSLAGNILGCEYDPENGTGSSCEWGDEEKQFTDGKTVYLKSIPKDPSGGLNYYYRSTNNNQSFQLYAHLENSQDSNACIGGNCTTPPVLPEGVTCGSASCNFSITSPNIRATDPGL